MAELSGVINIYKEKGYTSHDVVNIVRKELSRVKTGHTGTLDPNAEGVLPICIGKATKISEYIASEIKGYRAEVILGITTDTLDITGNIISESPVNITKDLITEVVKSFVGDIEQVPPMYSAIKIDGKKLYDLARKGIEVKRKSREVKIKSINIIDFIGENKFIIDVVCSKGTYIRTLCDDIGRKLGVGAVMGELLRTKTGDFYLKDSIKLNDFKEIVKQNCLNEILIPIETALYSYSHAFVSESVNKFLYNGNKVDLKFVKSEKEFFDKEKILIFDFKNSLIGVYEVLLNENLIKPVTMLYNH